MEEDTTHTFYGNGIEHGESVVSAASPPDRIITFPCLSPKHSLVNLQACEYRQGLQNPDEAGTPFRAQIRVTVEELIEVNRVKGVSLTEFNGDHNPVANGRIGHCVRS